MRPITQLLRLMYISWILVRHGLDDLILASHLFRPIRWVRYILPWLWLPRKGRGRGIRIRTALEDLGPIFVKFGQILSTRRDLLPDDIAIELAKLQDQVPPFGDKLARDIIEKAFAKDISEIFKSFETTPFASASIAQVHGAVLHDDTQVVVKVLRPNILRIIQRDIGLLYVIADKIERYWSMGKRLHAVDVVKEFEKTLLDELDLMREAANASQLRRNFLTSSQIYIPEIYWDYCHKTVMVMERIHGIPIGNIDALKDANINLQTLAETGVEIFFTQVFRDSFFHADMHPGNIFVSPTGKYIAVDFGIMGSLNPIDQRYLAENFLAFFNRDYRRVAQLHIDSGWVAKDTRIDEFEAAIRTVCEPIFDKPLKEISFGHLLLRLFQVARRFNMEVQPQLVLLQKTLLNIEGLGRQLYPELDLWKTAKPFLERWMASQIGPKAMWQHLKENIPLWAEQIPKLPNLFFETLDKARKGDLQYQLDTTQLDEIKKQIKNNYRRQYTAITGSGLLISSILSIQIEELHTSMLGPLPTLSWALGGLGAVILILGWHKNR